ncbi:heavy metal-associated isoprenylated plant protein 28 [Silene latifolia]|uniref:heavy metal-associated isoprenylated plant protein 28 n=1 Tax=Silene latifolia TaxID=37657 RepID=UPI003D76D03A
MNHRRYGSSKSTLFCLSSFLHRIYPRRLREASMTTVTEMRVHMCCAGCESKIRKTLQKIKGVDEVDIDMGLQKVTVNGYADQKKILKAARQSGRRAELWQFPYQPELRSFTHQYPTNCQGNGAVGTTYSQPQASSSYNYFKHGYDGHEYHGYHHNYNNASHSSSSLTAGRTGDVFSDENPHACSIM